MFYEKVQIPVNYLDHKILQKAAKTRNAESPLQNPFFTTASY